MWLVDKCRWLMDCVWFWIELDAAIGLLCLLVACYAEAMNVTKCFAVGSGGRGGGTGGSLRFCSRGQRNQETGGRWKGWKTRKTQEKWWKMTREIKSDAYFITIIHSLLNFIINQIHFSELLKKNFVEESQLIEITLK